jgi:hypothetical protein
MRIYFSRRMRRRTRKGINRKKGMRRGRRRR